jgi:hypothetical protein
MIDEMEDEVASEMLKRNRSHPSFGGVASALLFMCLHGAYHYSDMCQLTGVETEWKRVGNGLEMNWKRTQAITEHVRTQQTTEREKRAKFHQRRTKTAHDLFPPSACNVVLSPPIWLGYHADSQHS